MFDDRIRILFCCFFISHIQASGYTKDYTNTGDTQDQTSPRANTLSDDADDIQRQLDNEAKDRIKYGRPKTIWVFHFPNHMSNIMESSKDDRTNSLRESTLLKSVSDLQSTDTTTDLPPFEEWDYKLQSKWYQKYPECGGRSQSPVDLPVDGLVRAKGARKLIFGNYNVMPLALTLVNDGKRVMLFGEWPKRHQPLIYGGAAHSRRYVFHSLTLHWPSEHTVGGMQYPIESQAIHISAEYKSLHEAIQASPSDPQAFLGVVNMYKFSNDTQSGLADLIHYADMVSKSGVQKKSIENKPLSYFNPPFKEYACYYGSLTTPPCTESVLWLVRGRTLSVVREIVNAAQAILGSNEVPRKHLIREPQALNDRKVFLFS